MAKSCDSCGRAIAGAGVRTATRTLCNECGANFLGQAAGLIASHGDVGQAIATQGWFQRLRNPRAPRPVTRAAHTPPVDNPDRASDIGHSDSMISATELRDRFEFFVLRRECSDYSEPEEIAA